MLKVLALPLFFHSWVQQLLEKDSSSNQGCKFPRRVLPLGHELCQNFSFWEQLTQLVQALEQALQGSGRLTILGSVQNWHFVMWFSEHGGVWARVVFDDIGGLFQT